MFTEFGRDNLTAENFAAMCGGKLARGRETDLRVCSVCTDSREVKPGTAFVAIKGARTDGHAYLASVEALGASAALVSYIPDDYTGNMPLVLVDDTVAALMTFAGAYCGDGPDFRIAVTGSVGKTTAKEMLRSVLDCRGCYCSRGNFNSLIGMPLSYVGMPRGTAVSVFELGLEGCTDISRMSGLLKPALALVTNVGSSHLENIGSREKLIYEKLSVADGLRPGGTLLIGRELKNEADLLGIKYGKPGIDILTFSVSGEEADFTVCNLRENGVSQTFDLICPDRVIRGLEIKLYGKHNLQAALTAAAAGDIYGLTADEISRGLLSYTPVGLRQEVIRTGGITLINDCYNASPESMRAACDVLCGSAIGIAGRRAAVLGDMLELGRDTEKMHKDTGRYFAKSGLDRLFTFGPGALKIAEGAAEFMPKENITVFTDVTRPSDVTEKVLEYLKPGDGVLVKASRRMALERVSGALISVFENKKAEDEKK